MNSSNTVPAQEAFRQAMASVCTPVAVLTALQDGAPFGTTVSAFASLSMSPPMLLVSLDQGSGLLAVIRRVREFGVNILSSAQADLARVFAQKGGTDKFRDVVWRNNSEVPHLPDAIAFLSCRVVDLVEAGDHVIVLGDVILSESVAAEPLTYHRRSFGTHAVIDGAR